MMLRKNRNLGRIGAWRVFLEVHIGKNCHELEKKSLKMNKFSERHETRVVWRKAPKKVQASALKIMREFRQSRQNMLSHLTLTEQRLCYE